MTLPLLLSVEKIMWPSVARLPALVVVLSSKFFPMERIGGRGMSSVVVLSLEFDSIMAPMENIEGNAMSSKM